MGLKKKTEQIAADTARDVANAIAATIIQQIQSQGTAGESGGAKTAEVVKALSANKFVVKDASGKEKTVTSLNTGNRPIGPKTAVVLNGQFLIA